MPSSSSPSQATSRISVIASHLSAVPNDISTSTTAETQPAAAMTTAERPPITCHILDTTTGTPAPNVSCTLTLIRIPDLTHSPALNSALLSHINENGLSFQALTNEDGRVTAWSPGSESGPGAGKELRDVLDKTHEMHWRVTFEIGTYYGQKGVTPFFNKVDIHFVTGGQGQEGREHYHVPLLVGPYNYTTYRGS